jgi:omega-amidase
MKDFKIALCQIKPATDKSINLEKAKNMIAEAARNDAEIVVFGEMFNCPYQNEYFPMFAESIPGGDTFNMLKNCAIENKVYIVGGSIPEICDGVIYNTSCVFNRDGDLIAKHRKIHLFDVEFENGLKFKESDSLGCGTSITVFDTEYCKIGLAICYDVRFPEACRIMTLEGAEVIIIPAAFNMVTGPAHWELLFRSRAMDNQVYMVGVSPARNTTSKYTAYGNSIITGPWGDIITKTDDGECIIYGSLNGGVIDKVRKELPLLKHRRTDIYELTKK